MNTVTKPKNPPATEGAESGTSSTEPLSAPSAAVDVSVAYHDGPTAIGYFGSRWERGKARTVSAADWAAMQARGDCAPFDFRVV